MSADEGAQDPLLPGVWRRTGRRGMSECKCVVCGKWSSPGLVTGDAPPFFFYCPKHLPPKSGEEYT